MKRHDAFSMVASHLVYAFLVRTLPFFRQQAKTSLFTSVDKESSFQNLAARILFETNKLPNVLFLTDPC